MPEVRAHSLAVILDVVTRYDIDGVHLDDYFYPYPVNDDQGNRIDFPDSETYQRYRDTGGRLSKDDWRRENVNGFIRDLYQWVKAIRPHVKVGLSPFGIYRPANPAYIKGFDQYDQIYADALLWYQEGWCDYFSPQLYWAIDNPDQSFTGLLGWWHEQNTSGRHLWPGLFTSRTADGTPRAFDAQEIGYQIQWTRIYDEHAPGHVQFSMRALAEDREQMATNQAAGVFQHQTLVPASPWLGATPRPAPVIADWSTTPAGRVSITLDPASLQGASVWVVQVRRGDRWSYQIVPAASPSADFAATGIGPIDEIAVWAVDRTGQGGHVTQLRPSAR